MATSRVVRIEAPAAREDELVGRLWALGCEGSWSEPTEADRVRLHAFFAAESLPMPNVLDSALGGPEVVIGAAEGVADRDWQAEWRATARPVDVGRRFRVDPREPEEAEPEATSDPRLLLRLPARTAFGIGSHESTALVIELLETLPVEGRRVIDVGTGTGILAFAALHLGARSALALDIDVAATLLAPAMQRLNSTRFPVYTGTLAALGATADGRFDLALVNVVPHEIAADLPRLAAVMAPGAFAIFSGILSAESAAALSALGVHGFSERTRRQAGEWIAFVVERGT